MDHVLGSTVSFPMISLDGDFKLAFVTLQLDQRILWLAAAIDFGLAV